MAKKSGVCQLSGEYGQFVKCHILPQALTKPREKGSPLLQSTKGRGHKKRWTSWYDPSIVTRDGEDILSAIDNQAIKELRSNKLVWSGWGVAPPIVKPLNLATPDHSLRIAKGINHEVIERFFLSVMWRASVSKLADFRDFKLAPKYENDLKHYLLSSENRFETYPICLTQLTTIGEVHNHSPYLSEKQIPALNGIEAHAIPMARIYVDGLIAHVHLSASEKDPRSHTSIFLGHSSELAVSGITYERSFQYENLLVLAYESYLGPISS